MARALCNLRLIHTSHNPSFLERETERVCPPLPRLFCLSLDIRKSVCEAAFQAGSTSCSAQTQVWATAKCLKLKLEACDERLSDLLSRPNNLQSGVLTFSLSALEPHLSRGQQSSWSVGYSSVASSALKMLNSFSPLPQTKCSCPSFLGGAKITSFCSLSAKNSN